MKRHIVMICVIVMIMSLLTGCSKDNKNEKKSIKIGVSVYDQYDTFIASLTSTLTKLAKEKEEETGVAITIDIENAAGSQTTQNDQIEKFIENKYDIICINLVDRTDTAVIIDKVKSADVPVIFFNRELVEDDLNRWDSLYYVGAEALVSGELEGNIVNEICSKNMEKVDKNGDGVLQYVMIEGEAGHQDALLRTEYSINTIVDAGYEVEKLADESANWKRTQAQTKMTQWISAYGDDIELVICNNDDMALGAIDILKQNKDISMPVVVGIDGTKEALLAVKDGSLAGTVYNDNVGQARAILELAYSIETESPLPDDIELMDNKTIRLPYEMVTPSNVDQFISE